MSEAAEIVNRLLEDGPGDPSSKILAVIHRGPIHAIGPVVYDCENKPIMNTTELHGAIQDLGRRGIVIHRTDSGGSPTWDVVPSAAHNDAMPEPKKPRQTGAYKKYM